VVPDGQKGGTIWTTPVVDAARNTVYVTTGNRADDATGPSQQHAEAIVALDATTLAVKSHWSLPLADPTPDSDWGTAPTFSKDSLGRDVVTAGNKNGVVYAFLRDNLSAGPIWFRRVAVPAHGPDPAAGGLYSNGYFDGRRIFYAGGLTTIKGERAEGSIRALDPRTGGLFWEKALPTKTYGALTAANGMLVVPSRDALRVLDPVTGNVLYANELGLFGAATVANGRLFIGDVPGVFRAFGFPAFPGEGEAAATAASVAPSCEPPVGDSTVTCEVRLVEGCQRLESLGALADAKAVRIARVGQPRGRVRLELHPGHECAGRPLARTTLGDDGLRLPVPAAYRTSSGTGILAVEASQPARVSVTAARDR
jgi:PQQ-like domain